MKDFYTRFHQAAAVSAANAQFCERLYGKNLYQQGFAEVAHLDHLIEVTGIGKSSHLLDLGCGNGGIAEYIAEVTDAQVTGIDYIPEAIEIAQARTQPRGEHLHFQVMDIAHLDFPPASFDVIIAVDTLYFSDLDETLTRMVNLLKPGGRMGVFYSQSCLPWIDLETFPKESVQPDGTDLAKAFQRLHLAYQTWDYTAHDDAHAQRRKILLPELKPLYEQEDRLFLYESYWNEANGVSRAVEGTAHGRYLYIVTLP
ncbi:MAG TPA: class I SAM-dependent methyltransferase [Anaerolineales bacterium]|nr:class I SAM-dependent methyltransferase [Anaerolineales bacterium]